MTDCIEKLRSELRHVQAAIALSRTMGRKDSPVAWDKMRQCLLVSRRSQADPAFEALIDAGGSTLTDFNIQYGEPDSAFCELTQRRNLLMSAINCVTPEVSEGVAAYNIDATGSQMSEEQIMAILAKNNRQLAKDIAAINRDPRTP